MVQEYSCKNFGVDNSVLMGQSEAYSLVVLPSACIWFLD